MFFWQIIAIILCVFAEYLLNKTVQDLLRWAEKLLSQVKADIEDPTLTTAGLTELQQRLDSHQRDCQTFENYSEVAAVIKVSCPTQNCFKLQNN